MASSLECSCLKLSTNVYRLTAIKKAAYRFMGRYVIQIEPLNADEVEIRFTQKTTPSGPELSVDEFVNEVCDQDLRESVAEETKSIRDLILAECFSSFSLVNAAGDDGTFETDPLSIRAAGGPPNATRP